MTLPRSGRPQTSWPADVPSAASFVQCDSLVPSARRRYALLTGWISGSLITALMLMTLRASADGDVYTDDLPRVLAYQGHIARGGEGFNGTLDMTLSLYASTSSANPLWTEDQTVDVHRGEFSVLLGSTTSSKASALAELFRSAAPVYLGVSFTTSSGTVVDLEGRKPLLPMAHAVVATATIADLSFDGLNIVGNGTTSDEASGPLALEDGNGQKVAMDGDTISSDQVFRLNWFSGGPVHVHGDLTMTGGSITGRSGDGILSVTEDDGRLTIDAGDYHDDPSDSTAIYVYGNAQFTGEWLGSDDITDGGHGFEALETNVGFNNCEWHNVYDEDGSALATSSCSNGRVITGLVLKDRVGDYGKAIEQYECCSAKLSVE